MKIGDLIEVRAFPAVVQAHDIRDLRDQTPAQVPSAALRDFVGGYLGFDERSRDALNMALQSLFAANGGAFFFNGVFGSGKSHLLGLLALLCDGLGHRAFIATHPHLAPLLAAHSDASRLTVHFSLDEYEATQWSLEAIFWRELKREWTRRGWPETEISMDADVSRGEQFGALEAALAARAQNGLAVFIDELSLFLGARDHRALQGDAAFLQFLGQRARRVQSAPQSTLGGLWIFAALQKTVEDIGGLEPYSLAQIRDRFRLLPLSLAHVPSLIEHRLVVRRIEAADDLERVCRDSFDDLSRALPRLDFGRDEWQKLYPFHPPTVMLLEAVVSRFFSRTRSAALFCAQVIALENGAAQRVLPRALFDYLAPEWETHPDLRALGSVWKSWNENLPDLADNPTDAAFLQSLMQALLLFKIAGVAPTVVQIANAVAFDARLPADGNYAYAKVLLERLRTRGGHLALERHEGEWADRYAIDAGARARELAHRAIQNALLSLPTADARTSEFALSCCRDEPLPLSSFQTPRAIEVFWRNAPRTIEVTIWNADLSPDRLANRIAALSQAGHAADALLLIAPPFADVEAAKVLWSRALELCEDESTRAGAIFWQPRPALRDETEAAREATAAHGLESDPQLLDNRRGRAVLAHLRGESASRQTLVAQLSAHLLREGELISGAHLAIEAGDLAAAESWAQTLESIVDWALPARFARWPEVAPRLRVLTPANAEALCLEILRRPLDAPFFAPSHERAVRGLAEPLGLAVSHQGRWQIQAGRPDLIADFKSVIGEVASLISLEATLAKSRWGLRPEQTQMALCALLRGGEIVAFDARGNALVPAQIGLPLARSIQSLRPGARLETAQWQLIVSLLELLGLDAGAFRAATSTPAATIRDFTQQEATRALLWQWRNETASELELAAARLHQWRRQFSHTPSQWAHSNETLGQLEAILSSLNGADSSFETLSRAAQWDQSTLSTAWEAWKQLSVRLEAQHALLVGAHAFLIHPQLSCPPDLAPARHALLARFELGEALLQDETLAANFVDWREQYAAAYRDWHASQNAAENWSPLRALASGDELRVLEQLSRLQNRRFEGAAKLRAALSTESEKNCARDGQIVHEPICPACRLRWGERIAFAGAAELRAISTRDFQALRHLLREAHFRPFIERDAQLTALSEWSQWSQNEDETLLPPLDEAALRSLDEALRPRRRVQRSAQTLLAALASCRTKSEIETAFAAWLDNSQLLGPDDEIEWQENTLIESTNDADVDDSFFG